MENSINYAGFWIRFAACFIDGLIVNTIILIFWAVSLFAVLFLWGAAPGASFFQAHAESSGFSASLIFTGFDILIGWLYLVLQWSSAKQATFGMRCMGVKIVGYDYGPISFGHATKRWFALFLSALTLGIGYIMIAFTRRKQGLHDMIARTYVIRS